KVWRMRLAGPRILPAIVLEGRDRQRTVQESWKDGTPSTGSCALSTESELQKQNGVRILPGEGRSFARSVRQRQPYTGRLRRLCFGFEGLRRNETSLSGNFEKDSPEALRQERWKRRTQASRSPGKRQPDDGHPYHEG